MTIIFEMTDEAGKTFSVSLGPVIPLKDESGDNKFPSDKNYIRKYQKMSKGMNQGEPKKISLRTYITKRKDPLVNIR